MTKLATDADFFLKNRDEVVFYVRSILFLVCPVFSLFFHNATIFCSVNFFLCSPTLQRFFVGMLSICLHNWWHML
jgi:hypothetical protein